MTSLLAGTRRGFWRGRTLGYTLLYRLDDRRGRSRRNRQGSSGVGVASGVAVALGIAVSSGIAVASGKSVDTMATGERSGRAVGSGVAVGAGIAVAVGIGVAVGATVGGSKMVPAAWALRNKPSEREGATSKSVPGRGKEIQIDARLLEKPVPGQTERGHNHKDFQHIAEDVTGFLKRTALFGDNTVGATIGAFATILAGANRRVGTSSTVLL